MSQKTPERIAIPDLQSKMEAANKLTIVDVRTTKEIQETGAVPDAIHIPVDQINQHIDEIPKSGDIVFYCGGGGRASRAAQAAWDAGRRNIYYFGLRDWKRRNLPTVKTAKSL